MKKAVLLNFVFLVIISCTAQINSDNTVAKYVEAYNYLGTDKQLDSLVKGYFNQSIKPSVYDSIVFIEQANWLHVFEKNSSIKGIDLLDSLISVDEKNRFTPYFFDKFKVRNRGNSLVIVFSKPINDILLANVIIKPKIEKSTVDVKNYITGVQYLFFYDEKDKIKKVYCLPISCRN